MKLMILGGGSNQVALIQKVKNMGHTVVLIDYLDDCPGRYFCDLHLKVSTFDIDAVYDAAKNHGVDGVVTAGTDQPVLTAAIVSERLGLRFYLDSDTALRVTNKIHMKKTFVDNNIPCVNYRLVKSGFDAKELDGLKFPVVIKPVDSQGQRGIFFLESIDEVKDKIDETLSFSKQDVALVEEYYKNDEITVNGIVSDGKFEIISIVDRVTMRDRIGVCIGHNAQSAYAKKYYEQIKNITADILKAFNILDGPIYFQYLIGDEGIKVNEIAMRVGGAYEGTTIPIIADIDILKYVIDYACGSDGDPIGDFKYSNIKDVFLSTQLFYCEAGKIAEIDISEVKNLDYLVDIYLEYKKGDVIHKIENATARAGYFIAHGNSFDDMLDSVDKVFDGLKVLNDVGENLIMRYADYRDKYLFTDEYR